MQGLINQKDRMYYALKHLLKFRMHALFICIFCVRISLLGCGLGGILLINDGMLSLFSRYSLIMLFIVIHIKIQMKRDVHGHARGHGRGRGRDHVHDDHDDHGDDDGRDHEFI
jgi:hypothetical protein